MTQRPYQCGYILLPVVLALTLVAVAAYLINRDSAMDANIAAGQKQADEARYVAEATAIIKTCRPPRSAPTPTAPPSRHLPAPR
jgi:hypothetical protein